MRPLHPAPSQHPLTSPRRSPPPIPPPDLLHPITNPIAPMARHQRAGNDINDFNQEQQERISFLDDL